MSIINTHNVTVNQDGAIVNGNNCIINGHHCIVNGNNCTVNGNHCIVNGNNCTVNGNYCAVKGANCAINGDNCDGSIYNPMVNSGKIHLFDSTNNCYSIDNNSNIIMNSIINGDFKLGDSISDIISGGLTQLFPVHSYHLSSSYYAPPTYASSSHNPLPKPSPSSVENKEFPIKKDPVEAKDDDPNTCNICMVNKKDVLLIPCGHVMCVVCARQMWEKKQCPDCRGKIDNVNQAFF